MGRSAPEYTPPTVRGSRIYRLKVMNHNGPGSYTSSGDYLATSYSECVRVTYYPYFPNLKSAVCNTAVFAESIHEFSLPQPPDEDGFANYDSIVWQLTRATNDPVATTITFPNGDDYTAAVTFPDVLGFYFVKAFIYYSGCGSGVYEIKCRVRVAPPSCGYIHVDPVLGDDLNEGGPTTPKKDLAQAAAVVDENTYHIRLLGGRTYTIPALQQIHLKDKTVIEGGFEYGGGNNWRKDLSGGRSIIDVRSDPIEVSDSVYHRVAIIADNVDKWGLFDLELQMFGISGQTADGRGRSVYGIWINDCDSFVIKNCVIDAGNASVGRRWGQRITRSARITGYSRFPWRMR